MADTAESRLDRIERILEETAVLGQQNEGRIAAVTKAQDALAAAMKDMIEAQTILFKTMDRLAQLRDRSPN
jgi:outer membrane protein TolC